MSDDASVGRRDDGGGVSVVTIKNPPVNALSTRVMTELGEVFGQLASDASARAVVLTGDGTYFCAGADLKEMTSLDAARAGEVVRTGHRVLGQIAKLPVPVLAAINGLAVGGGLELALACDLRICGDAAKLGAPEVNYGLMPAYGGTQRLARLIGPAKARELIFTGNLVAANEALRIGLVNRMVPSGQELRASRDLAHTIADRAPKAVAAAKVAIAEGIERPLDGGLGLEAQIFAERVLPSADLQEGIRAFLERRPPKFEGK